MRQTGRIGHGLVGGAGQIDDGEPAMPEQASLPAIVGGAFPESVAVRAAMRDGVRHSNERFAVACTDFPDDSCDATHMRWNDGRTNWTAALPKNVAPGHSFLTVGWASPLDA